MWAYNIWHFKIKISIHIIYQVVRIGGNWSSPLTLSPGTPQGCDLSPMLYSLCIYECASCHESTQILKYDDDTTVLGIVTNSGVLDYRDQVNKRMSWCSEHNLEFKVNKTKFFRRNKPSHLSHILIDITIVEIVQHFKFLGSTICSNLK